MKEINEAYSVLSDKEKRQKYDSFGTADESSFYSNSGDFSQDSSFFDEIFNTFFGEKTSSSRKEETKTTDGSVYLELTLNFKESIFGIKKSCNATGAYSASDIVFCYYCEGKEIINTIQKTLLGHIRTQTVCDKCLGKGKMIKRVCVSCKGKKIIQAREEFILNIPRGIKSDTEYRYKGMGNDIGTGKRGDLLVTFLVKKSKYFERKEDDIHVKVPISIFDSIFGSYVKIFTLEGIETINVLIGSESGFSVYLPKKGCYTGINTSERDTISIEEEF
uniref:CR-type domain-containing protein n=1 Tax=Meloidogyne floridensis TaxID=298350 RepID=A0A915NYC0_9BILA